MATTGCSPAKAIPAADVVACCSAIPTSKTRLGNASAKAVSPTGASIAAVIPTTSRRSCPMATISAPNTEVHVGLACVTG